MSIGRIHLFKLLLVQQASSLATSTEGQGTSTYYSMASKLPKLVLPAYDLRTKNATYHHYAEAVFKANPGTRGVVAKEALDKAWFTAVKNHWPGNQAKREELFHDVSRPLYFSEKPVAQSHLYGRLSHKEPPIGGTNMRRNTLRVSGIIFVGPGRWEQCVSTDDMCRCQTAT